MRIAWGYLVLAGLFEVGWPLGLKLAQAPGGARLGIPLAVGGMSVSGCLLFLAQKQIPLGTAYAVWTGIGAAGAFLAGVVLYGEAASAARLLGVSLIVSGVVTLKLGL
jgi:quaternary ammonium compound-resistance protein SugE